MSTIKMMQLCVVPLFFLVLMLIFGQSARAEPLPQSYWPNFQDAEGWQQGDFRLRTSIYTVHYHPQTEHNNRQRLINLEYVRPDRWLVGAAAFHNSFNQPSQYLYVGHDWPLWQSRDWTLRATLTGGLLHGYHGEYKNKIPLNQMGVAPVLLPYLGLSYRQSFFVEAHFFATAGIMATAGVRF